jgi:hypothetical protein
MEIRFKLEKETKGAARYEKIDDTQPRHPRAREIHGGGALVAPKAVSTALNHVCSLGTQRNGCMSVLVSCRYHKKRG